MYSNRNVLHAKSCKGVDKQDIRNQKMSQTEGHNQDIHVGMDTYLPLLPRFRPLILRGFRGRTRFRHLVKTKSNIRTDSLVHNHYNSNVTLRVTTNKHGLCSMCLHLIITEKREEIQFHSHLFSFFL